MLHILHYKTTFLTERILIMHNIMPPVIQMSILWIQALEVRNVIEEPEHVAPLTATRMLPLIGVDPARIMTMTI